MAMLSDHTTLFHSVRKLITDSRQRLVRNINTEMLVCYFEIGRLIVQNELQGKQRADYAERIVRQLSTDLTREFGKGYSKSNLEYMRQFYTTYQDRSSIIQSPVGQSTRRSPKIVQSPIGQSNYPFQLSWTHYIQLLKISNPAERQFYEIEAVQGNWSVRELQRQYQAALYERLAITRDKTGVKALARKGQLLEKPLDTIKSPFVLEFLDLRSNSQYTENDLETAIINKLENFMTELGKGFLFEGRQKRFTFEGDSFYVDLVFYNRLLRAFCLIDLKIGRLTHQDIGQMQMYVNYYDRMIKTKEENPTIGIILCREENRAVVEFTLPEDNQHIFAKEYSLYLPAKEELKKQLR